MLLRDSRSLQAEDKLRICDPSRPGVRSPQNVVALIHLDLATPSPKQKQVAADLSALPAGPSRVQSMVPSQNPCPFLRMLHSIP